MMWMRCVNMKLMIVIHKKKRKKKETRKRKKESFSTTHVGTPIRRLKC